MRNISLTPCRTNDAILFVESYHGGEMTGKLLHPKLQGPAEFQSLPQLLMMLDELLQQEKGLVHSFAFTPTGLEELQRIATLRVQVLLREHHSWQGRILWEEKQKEAVFRSVLELIQIMDEILGE